MQLRKQGIQLRADGARQPGNTELAQRFGFLTQRDQFIAKGAVLRAVVQMQLAGVEQLANLAVDPEFIAGPVELDGLPVLVQIQ